MADIVDPATRSRMMSGIRAKNTRAEVEIRKRLFALGFRYRLHDRKLPGKPDIVLLGYNAAIFIHGCFWHAHDCHLFRLPTSKKLFWKKKLLGNKKRDETNIVHLISLGWRVLTIWECSFRGASKVDDKEIDRTVNKTVKWLESKKRSTEIRGKR